MRSETIEIETADGTAEAYLTRPDGGDEHPGVLLLIDAIGLRPRIEEMADRIAAWGYTVLAPNLFYRTGTAEELAPSTDLRAPGAREAFFAGIGDRIHGMTRPLIELDNAAWLEALRGLPDVGGGGLGVTGYCLGGRLGLIAAEDHPDDVAAVGLFHASRLVTDDTDSPHRDVDRIRGEVLAGHADHDHGNTAEDVAALDAALDAAGVARTTAIYPDAPHGFSMADTSMYDEAATERHFTELEALFARTLRQA